MARALIVGAGAIGRGFVPWALGDTVIDFFDASEDLMKGITRAGGYNSHMSIDGALSSMRIRPQVATSKASELPLNEYDVSFVAVGPRNVSKLPKELGGVRGPIFSLENDPATVDVLREHLGRTDVFFGVPDVITSSTASPENLASDRLSLHTEDGVLFLEDSKNVGASLKLILSKVEWLNLNQLKAEWDAKLYLHNTPHCVAAYLGFLLGKKYVHETFEHEFASRVVSGVIHEMLTSLKSSTAHDHDFLDNYALKELRRFSNPLLFDPILRVAREPLRKLQQNGRLTGALRLSILSGVEPFNLMLGIAAALEYRETRDEDARHMASFDDSGPSLFLKYHLGIQPEALESLYIQRHTTSATEFLKRRLG
jgi:mannitol-1-phosphate/altronate dehydrogenase